MAYKEIPKIDGRGFAEIMEEIARLAEKYTPEWKFSPDDPDAGTALACVFARRTAETIEKFNQTPLNHRREFYNMLGAQALPAVPSSGYVQFRLSGINKECFSVNEGFRLFSPVIDGQGTRLSFETTQNAYIAQASVKETVYADSDRDLLCFWDEKEKPFEPHIRANSNERYLCFRHKLLESMTENCRLYMTISGIDGERWAKRLSDPLLARFVQISDNKETEIDCFEEKGRMRIAVSACNGICDEIKAEIKKINEFEGLLFEGINIAFEGRNIKPDSVFANGELVSDDTLYAFGEAPAVYDSVYIESAAAFSKSGATVSLAFDIDFDIVVSGELPEPVIPDKLFVRKSDVHAPGLKKITVDEVVWEYWNGTGFAAIRGLEGFKNIFSGIDEDGSNVQKSHYELKFVCPSDLLPVLTGAAQRLCVRARIKRIKNAYAFPSEVYLPRLENIRVSYKYDRPLSVSDIEIANNCEKSSDLRLYPFSRLPGSALYIGLDDPVRNFTLLVCRDFPSDQLDEAEWSVFSDNRWKKVSPRSKKELTGFFSFEMQTEPMQSTMFGRTAYWLKAELPRKKEIVLDKLLLNCVPVMQRETVESFCSDNVIENINLDRKNILELQIYINTAKRNQEEKWEPLQSHWALDKAEGIIRFSPALTLTPNSRTVKLNYRCGGGLSGNIPAGGEFVPSLTDGSVCGAANPFPMTGGCDSENASHTESRLAGELRHRGRPITKRDFEELIADGDIISARVCADRGGGLDIEVTTTIGVSSEDIRSRVYSKLSDILPVGVGEVKIRVVCENR
ncbi:MAG: hypothetical protein J1F28_04670 [Oscillospiraceae bacterium]|nr:hypothetical protein [Oscillospiraceae bacterium]